MERKCVCCGGKNLITRVSLTDNTNYSEERVKVSVEADPSAWVFKGTVRANLHGEVCDDCGHLQLFVQKREGLRAAHQARQSNISSDKIEKNYIVCSNCSNKHTKEDCPKCGVRASIL